MVQSARLPTEEFGAIEEIAERAGVPVSALICGWVLQGLAANRAHRCGTGSSGPRLTPIVSGGWPLPATSPKACGQTPWVSGCVWPRPRRLPRRSLDI